MRKAKVLIFLFISLVGFILVYWFWPKDDQLPVMDKIKGFQMEEVHGGMYELDNEKVKLVAFFYTSCPDICPMTMVDFKDLQAELKSKGLFSEDVELVAITIDPEHDSPSVIKQYASAFHADPSGWKWLRGTSEQTKKIATDLQMQYQKLDGDFFSHTITMYLIDSENQIRALYEMANGNKPVEKERILQDIIELVNNE